MCNMRAQQCRTLRVISAMGLQWRFRTPRGFTRVRSKLRFYYSSLRGKISDAMNNSSVFARTGFDRWKIQLEKHDRNLTLQWQSPRVRTPHCTHHRDIYCPMPTDKPHGCKAYRVLSDCDLRNLLDINYYAFLEGSSRILFVVEAWEKKSRTCWRPN